MTIEEQFEKLRERHEAITQTIELMAIESRERDARWEKRFGFIGESLERLANVAQLHQHRLDSHQDRLDKLEGTA